MQFPEYLPQRHKGIKTGKANRQELQVIGESESLMSEMTAEAAVPIHLNDAVEKNSFLPHLQYSGSGGG